MDKLIFWLASYPKSGNTLLRAILVSLFFNKGLVLFPLMVLYLSWSIIQWMLDHDRLSDESHLRSSQSSDSK